jgi:hypothetical protein
MYWLGNSETGEYKVKELVVRIISLLTTPRESPSEEMTIMINM